MNTVCVMSVYDTSDESVAQRIPLTFMPHEGMRLVIGGDVWVVRDVQVFLPDAGSPGASEPPHVDVIAIRGRGIHL